MAQFIETDPDVIIERYRERADQYRRSPTGTPNATPA
jgi:hypothetical protein